METVMRIFNPCSRLSYLSQQRALNPFWTRGVNHGCSGVVGSITDNPPSSALLSCFALRLYGTAEKRRPGPLVISVVLSGG